MNAKSFMVDLGLCLTNDTGDEESNVVEYFWVFEVELPFEEIVLLLGR